MPKKKVEAPKHQLTKRQLTHWQRESRIQRFTLWGGIAIIVIVLALIGTGLYLNKFKPFQQIVFKVGDTSYNMGYYIDAIDYYGQINFAYFQNLGVNYPQYLQYTANSMANTIQENQVLKETAAKLDPPIVVSTEEINKLIKDNNIPKSKATIDAAYAALLDGKLKDKFDKELPATSEQRAVLAMFLESQSQVDEVLARINKGETFNAIAETASLDSTTKTKSGDLLWVPKGVIPTILGDAEDKTLDDLVFSDTTKVDVFIQAEDKTKSKSQGYWIIQVTDIKQATTAEATPVPTDTPATTPAANTAQVQVNVMLLGSQELALAMKKQLQEGADFATLAKTNSQYTNAATDGGILGFIDKGKLGEAVDAVIFPEDASKMISKGVISDPISDTTQSTIGGLWLAKVTGIEVKTLEGTNRDTLTNNNKQSWRTKVWSDNSSRVVDLLDPAKLSFATTQATDRFNKK